MPFPSPISNIERSDVGDVVKVMLMNPQVTELDIHQQPDGLFTVVPRGDVVGGAVAALLTSGEEAPAPKARIKRAKRKGG
jgi:hypothetical protein